MKNRVMKGILYLILTLSLIALPVHAGFGDFNDYGSDWDMDWDSDWDDDWDSDFGDWNFSIFDSDSSGGTGMGSTAVGIAVVVVVVIVYGLAKSKTGSARTASTTKRVMRPAVRTQPPKTLPDRTNEISSLIKETDPNFTASDFLSFARQVYMDIQDAWEKRDLEPVRAVLHQNLYQQTQRQIEQKLADGIVNHLERISINTAYLTSFIRDEEYEYLNVYLSASMIDYQVKEATGQILYGNKDARWNMFYKMTFMRTRGAATRSAEEKAEGIMCPNCGAPMKGTSFGKCAYCDSVVLTGVYDWVLSAFGAIKSDTVDEGIRR